MSPQASLVAPKPAPPLNIPPSPNTVTVRIIDSTSRLEAPLGVFMGPPIPGHEILKGPAFSFLVEHSSGRKILFDLGCRKDWQNFPPAILNLVTQPQWKITVEKSVAEILQENGVDAAGGAIEAIVWSHWHYDHIGDPSTFPGSTKLIVGPGFKEAFMPGYPTKEDGLLLDSDFEGREVEEIAFEGNFKIGGFKAMDFFGDGSFYLLDSPGHAIGHMSALARVTKGEREEETFVLMGGDACHHGGEFRPTEYLPLPKDVKISRQPHRGVCPGALFEKLHYKKSATEPFYMIGESFAHNFEQAHQTMHDVGDFDAAENVLVVIAHDPALLEADSGVDWFPKGLLNGWKDKGVAENIRWTFLNDFAEAAVQQEEKEKI
jgi:glyoxylase-like metal-dependent hydrolase (beta-lactamase superfamily II)